MYYIWNGNLQHCHPSLVEAKERKDRQKGAMEWSEKGGERQSKSVLTLTTHTFQVRHLLSRDMTRTVTLQCSQEM